MGWEGPLTHRQFEAWHAWLDIQWDSPTRTDWYLMQVACEVRRVLAKTPGKIKVKQLKLKFESPLKTEAEERKDKQVLVEASKRQALSAVGLVKKIAGAVVKWGKDRDAN